MIKLRIINSLFFLLWLPIFFLFIHSALKHRHIVEDAYISFRYAANFASGHGPVFNPGERVEGSSSFLWVIWLGIAAKSGFPIPQTAQGIGLLASLLTLLISFSLTKQLCGRRVHPVYCYGPPLFVAVWPPFGVWSLSGMETTLFMLLVTAAVWAYKNSTGPFLILAPLLLLLSCLTRIEGVLFAFLIILWKSLSTRRIPQNEIWFFLLPLALYLLWRVSYYGYPLPNSFYAKYGFTRDHLSRGIYYTRTFLFGNLGILFTLPLFGWFFIPSLRKDGWIPLSVLAYTGCVTYLGGDIYPFSRYFLVIASIALSATFAFFVTTPGKKTFLASLLLVWLAFPPAYSSEMANYEFLRQNDQARMRFARHFAPTLQKDDTIAVLDAGILPYFLKVKTIDMIGLNDEHIAHRKILPSEKGIFGHEKHDALYVLQKRPSFVFFVLHHWNVKEASFPWIQNIKNLLFQDTYPLVAASRSDYPAQANLWELPAFKLYYRPVAFQYEQEIVIFYQLDKELAEILDKARFSKLSGPEEETVVARFLQKGCYREGEQFLTDLFQKGHIRAETLAKYRSAIAVLPSQQWQQYESFRNNMIHRHLVIVQKLLQEGKIEEAGERIRKAHFLYPEVPAIRQAWASYLQLTHQYSLPRIETQEFSVSP